MTKLDAPKNHEFLRLETLLFLIKNGRVGGFCAGPALCLLNVIFFINVVLSRGNFINLLRISKKV